MIRGALPPVTTRQTFIDQIEFFSDEDGTSFDLTGATAKVALMLDADRWPGRSFAGFFYDCGFAAAALISATVSVYGTAGIVEFTFTPAQMASLCPGQYLLACNLTRDGETAQILIGNLPVLDGVVPQ